MATPTDELEAGIASLYHNEDYSDLTIICGHKTFKVHKAVVCPRSKWFRAACREQWQQGADTPITLKSSSSEQSEDDNAVCDDPDIVQVMIHYLYKLDYEYCPPCLYQYLGKPRRNGGIIYWDGNLVHHAKVFAIATKFHIIGLQALAQRKFRDAIDLSWVHGSFAHAADIVYTSTPESETALRKMVVTAIIEHQELLDKPGVEAVVKGNIELMYDLLKRMRGKGAQAPRRFPGGYRCHACDDQLIDAECATCSYSWGSCGCSGGCPRCPDSS